MTLGKKKSKTYLYEANRYCSVMLRKVGKMSDTKSEAPETIWPEKKEAIYQQFPWLERLVKINCPSRAYVKKFDETTLELNKLSRRLNPVFSDPYDEHTNLIWFVNDSGKITRKLGVRVEKVKKWVFFGREIDVEFVGNDESVRQAVQNFSEADDSSYMVYFEDNTLTIFKPPQKGLTIKQWYDARVLALKQKVAEEVASV